MKIRLAALALAAVALAGCGSDGDSAANSDPSAQPSNATTKSSEPAPSSTSTTALPPAPSVGPDSDGDGAEDAFDQYPRNPYAVEPKPIKVYCDHQGGTENYVFDRAKPDFTKAWQTPLPEGRGTSGAVYCDTGEFGEGVKPVAASAVEAKLLELEKRPSEYTLAIPYSQCAEHGTKWMASQWPVSPQQVPEAIAALTLCPNHPDAAGIRERIGGQGDLQNELNGGTAFYDGTYRVGKRIKPGTYATQESSEGCYWERTDSAGEIIDNNFSISALRVEATISASDYSFLSEGCGLWRRVS